MVTLTTPARKGGVALTVSEFEQNWLDLEEAANASMPSSTILRVRTVWPGMPGLYPSTFHCGEMVALTL